MYFGSLHLQDGFFKLFGWVPDQLQVLVFLNNVIFTSEVTFSVNVGHKNKNNSTFGASLWFISGSFL